MRWINARATIVVALLLCSGAFPRADTLTLIGVSWDTGAGAYRWDYSLNPTSRIQGGGHIGIREMSGIVAATVEASPKPYKTPMPLAWDSAYTSTAVTWTHLRGTLAPNQDYAYFTYWSTDGTPEGPAPYYRDGIYEGDTTAATPEPASMLLFASALGVMFLRRRMSGDGTSLREMWRSPRHRGASALGGGGARSAGD